MTHKIDISEFHVPEDAEGVITGIVSSETIDTDKDIVRQEWEVRDQVPLLWAHSKDSKDPVSLGHLIDHKIIKEKGTKKLWAKFDIDLDDPFGKKIFHKIQRGDVTQFSVGFEPLDDPRELKEGRFEFPKNELYEVSILNVGSNRDTKVLETKSPDHEKAISSRPSMPDFLDQQEDEAKDEIKSVQQDILQFFRDRVRGSINDPMRAKEKLKRKFRRRVENILSDMSKMIKKESMDRMEKEINDKIEGEIHTRLQRTDLDKAIQLKIKQRSEAILSRITGYLVDQLSDIQWRTPKDKSLPVGKIGLDGLEDSTLQNSISKISGPAMNAGRQIVIDKVKEKAKEISKSPSTGPRVMIQRNERMDENICSECKELDGEIASAGSQRARNLTPPAGCLSPDHCRGVMDVIRISGQDIKNPDKMFYKGKDISSIEEDSKENPFYMVEKVSKPYSGPNDEQLLTDFPGLEDRTEEEREQWLERFESVLNEDESNIDEAAQQAFGSIQDQERDMIDQESNEKEVDIESLLKLYPELEDEDQEDLKELRDEINESVEEIIAGFLEEDPVPEEEETKDSQGKEITDSQKEKEEKSIKIKNTPDGEDWILPDGTSLSDYEF